MNDDNDAAGTGAGFAIPPWMCERFPNAAAALKRNAWQGESFERFVIWCAHDATLAQAWKEAMAKGLVPPWERGRQDDIDFLSEAIRQGKAARGLARFINRYPQKAAQCLGVALLSLKKEFGSVPLSSLTTTECGVNVFGHGPGSHTDVIAKLLRCFADELTLRPPAKAGPFLHRFTLGPFAFDKPLDAQTARIRVCEVGLLYGCVLYARAATSGEVAIPPVMPDTGRPLWPVAVAFLADALDVHIGEKEAQHRLSRFLARNPGVEFLGWPAPPPECRLASPNTCRRSFSAR